MSLAYRGDCLPQLLDAAEEPDDPEGPHEANLAARFGLTVTTAASGALLNMAGLVLGKFLPASQ